MLMKLMIFFHFLNCPMQSTEITNVISTKKERKCVFIENVGFICGGGLSFNQE
jgi:hypothetical protein